MSNLYDIKNEICEEMVAEIVHCRYKYSNENLNKIQKTISKLVWSIKLDEEIEKLNLNKDK